MPSNLIRSRPGASDIKPPSHTEAVPVVDNVWMSPGLSNTFMVTTADGRVIINTGMGFEAAVHKAVYDAVSTAPTRYILFTQGHVDHVGGAEYFRQPGTLLVAQANNANCQADDARIHRFRVRRSEPYWANAIRAADEFIRAQPPGQEIPAQATPTPDITFNDQFEFVLGGERFECLSTPGGETIDSMVVWMPGPRVAFAGNVFSALFGHFPNLVTLRADRLRFALPFIESVKRVRDLRPEVLCTGHFEPIFGEEVIAAEMQRLIDGVQWVHDEVVSGMNRGDDVHKLMRTVKPPEEISLGEGYGKVSWGVRSIWEGYAGWFHARSTTELYGYPASDASGEICDAAGVGALLDAARSCLDGAVQPQASAGTDADAETDVATGGTIRAIRLAEIVLDVDAHNVDALGVMVDAHKRLLALSDRTNFWLTGWLEHQIAQLSARLSDSTEGTVADE